MIKTLVTIRAVPHQERPPLKVDGYTLYQGCPLAVTHVCKWSEIDSKWNERDGFQVTHVPTGFHLGAKEFDSVADAMLFLERCDPRFAAWPLATGDKTEPATIACYQKFKMAAQITAEQKATP